MIILDDDLEKIYDIGPYEFKGKYSCTRDGRIFSNVSNQFLKGFPDGRRGYLKVKLYDKNGVPVTLFIHRIICTMFNGGNHPDHQVNYEDGDKLHNHYTNLTWMTPLENVRHSIVNKLSESRSKQLYLDKVHDICHCLFIENMSVVDVSKHFKISYDTVQKIYSKKNYTYISELYEIERFND